MILRPDHQTNSVKALKETRWSSKIRLVIPPERYPTRTTPPCYNNKTVLGIFKRFVILL